MDLAISLKEYTNIYNSILPFVKNLRNEYPLTEACVPINFFAYFILKNNFEELKPQFNIGHVLYCIGEQYLSYYDPNDYKTNSENNWHTYITLNKNDTSYYLDFMSPIFNEIAKNKIDKYYPFIEPKMFQKKTLDAIALTKFLNETVIKGDFYFNYQEIIFKDIMNFIDNDEQLQNKSKLSLQLYNSNDSYINLNGKKIKKSDTRIINMW